LDVSLEGEGVDCALATPAASKTAAVMTLARRFRGARRGNDMVNTSGERFWCTIRGFIPRSLELDTENVQRLLFANMRGWDEITIVPLVLRFPTKLE
jgi:hypothetical protein